jgi:hypothetical protein
MPSVTLTTKVALYKYVPVRRVGQASRTPLYRFVSLVAETNHKTSKGTLERQKEINGKFIPFIRLAIFRFISV